MKVLFINQFFHPDLAPTAQMATDLAVDLVARGHEVSVLTGQVPYTGGARLSPFDTFKDIQIHRVATTAFGRASVLHRAADYGSFYATALSKLLTLPPFDVVITKTSPPLISALGPVAKKVKGSQFVYWVQDLYPEAAIAFGVMNPQSATAKMAAATSRRILCRADRVVVLGAAMKRRVVDAGAGEPNVRIIPNWIDDDVVRPISHEANPLRADLSRGKHVLVMYSGNIGRGHDVETLLDAAESLQRRLDIGFVFIGDGVKRAEVEARSKTLSNVWLAPYVPREQLAQSLSAGDIHFISLSPELLGLLEPSKLYGVMAAARPAVFVGPEESEVPRTLARELCGLRVPNGDVDALVRAIELLADDDQKRAEWGGRARRALEAKYSRARATEKWAALLDELVVH